MTAMHSPHYQNCLPVPRITTVLTPDERLRVDAAGQGIYRALHRDSLNDALRDIRDHHAAAVIVSIARCDENDLPRVARVVREFPRVPAVALLSNLSPQTAQTVLVLGRCGVRTLVDVREPRGWQQLRSVLLHDQATEIHRVALARVAEDLGDAPEGCHRFFRALFEEGSETRTIQELSTLLGVVPSTLMSRFVRATLPPPKFYLSMARLVCAARMFENPGLSVTLVANELDYSSPQAFGRHLRAMLQLTAIQFRERYDGEGMLQRFRDELILPHIPRLRAFDPLGFEGLSRGSARRGYEA
ncbi:MAG TPA: helix-turn-helix domain-containing protein [Gemmatimonadaceae bacterium]|nr:helix-turn-helix domain-containing protein [Gemmatimonadaceae bacterium]